MASAKGFSLAEVLAVAKVHPFYSSEALYPPNEAALRSIKEQKAGEVADIAALQRQPILHKNHLYEVIKRLTQDTSPENTYRRSVYVSTTGGGGGGSKPLFFATDGLENRRQRAEYARLLKAVGVVKDTDWVISVHTSGGFSLDLTLELLENAGASVLAVGHTVPVPDVIQLAKDYHVNALSGDASQIIGLVNHIRTRYPDPNERDGLHIDKVIYTSETMTPGQRAYIREALPGVQICSFLGSAEAGPYAVSVPHLIEGGSATTHQDFVFDTRQTLIEILPLGAAEGDDQTPTPLPPGEQGLVVQTSLVRLRNPLVRYFTGDVGSVHELPESARQHYFQDEQDRAHLRVLRLKGRDARFSVEFDGEYVEFDKLTALMSREEHGVLQWQVVLSKHGASENSRVDIRVLTKGDLGGVEGDRVAALREAVMRMFGVDRDSEDRFSMEPTMDVNSFETNGPGRKVIRFIDRFNKP